MVINPNKMLEPETSYHKEGYKPYIYYAFKAAGSNIPPQGHSFYITLLT